MNKKKQPRKRVTLEAKKAVKKTPYAHVFDEAAIAFQAHNLLLKELAIKEQDIAHAQKINDFLQKYSIQNEWIKSFHQLEFYRITPPGRNPISCLGSFSAGGRVNLGTPQILKKLTRNFSASFGLYGSLERETAQEEYDSSGLPSGSSETYKITHRTPNLKLFDFDAVIESIRTEFHDFPIASVVSETPYDASWQYQKWPKVSQIIGAWLRNPSFPEVAGLLFRSTKRKNGTNLFLFFNNDLEDSTSKLSIQKLPL